MAIRAPFSPCFVFSGDPIVVAVSPYRSYIGQNRGRRNRQRRGPPPSPTPPQTTYLRTSPEIGCLDQRHSFWRSLNAFVPNRASFGFLSSMPLVSAIFPPDRFASSHGRRTVREDREPSGLDATDRSRLRCLDDRQFPSSNAIAREHPAYQCGHQMHFHLDSRRDQPPRYA